MSQVLKYLTAYALRIHWDRVSKVSSGAFLAGAAAYLALHTDPKATLTFALLGHQIEGATCAGILAMLPVLAGLLTNSVRDKQPAPEKIDIDALANSALDELIPPK